MQGRVGQQRNVRFHERHLQKKLVVDKKPGRMLAFLQLITQAQDARTHELRPSEICFFVVRPAFLGQYFCVGKGAQVPGAEARFSGQHKAGFHGAMHS